MSKEQEGGIDQVEEQAQQQEGERRASWVRGADKEQRSNQCSKKGEQ